MTTTGGGLKREPSNDCDVRCCILIVFSSRSVCTHETFIVDAAHPYPMNDEKIKPKATPSFVSSSPAFQRSTFVLNNNNKSSSSSSSPRVPTTSVSWPFAASTIQPTPTPGLTAARLPNDPSKCIHCCSNAHPLTYTRGGQSFTMNPVTTYTITLHILPFRRMPSNHELEEVMNSKPGLVIANVRTPTRVSEAKLCFAPNPENYPLCSTPIQSYMVMNHWLDHAATIELASSKDLAYFRCTPTTIMDLKDLHYPGRLPFEWPIHLDPSLSPTLSSAPTSSRSAPTSVSSSSSSFSDSFTASSASSSSVPSESPPTGSVPFSLPRTSSFPQIPTPSFNDHSQWEKPPTCAITTDPSIPNVAQSSSRTPSQK